MTFTSHYRNSSPVGGRHHVAGPRASTGMVQLGSSFDSHEQPRHFYDYDDYPSDAGYASTAYKHYPMRRSPVEARPVSTHKVHDPGHATKRRTEYTIEPQYTQPRNRSRSNTASAVDVHHNPARLSVPSHHDTGYGRSHSPVATSSGQYLVPGSHHGGRHRRVYSTDYASDTGRLDQHDRVKHRSSRHGSRHGSHNEAPPSSRRRHPDYESIKKGEDIDRYNVYSYTTPREQFDRDYPVRPRRHTARTSLDRPVSMTLMDEHPQWLSRRDRAHGPPPTSRGFDKLDREGRPRSTRGNDDYHHRETSRQRGGNDRSLVVVPHDSDDGYESYGDHHRRRHHHRDHRPHHESSRRHHDDRSPRRHDIGGNDRALVGLGTAALGNGYSDISDYDHRSAPRQHRRPRELERDYDATQSASRELIEGVPSGSDKSKQIYLEPVDPRMRHRSRSRRHSRRRRGSESDGGFTDDDDLRKYQREPSASPRHRHSSEDTSEDNHPASRRRLPRQRSHVRSPHRSRSPSNDSKDGGKKVVAVEPPAQKEPEVVPKGILKKPREAFPEEPNPVREGVAPLKDAEKNGIPPGARWTKIDRRLVNPMALRLAGERFEEREDYVIVLKVLSKEEIQKLAVATQAIRDARQKEFTRDRRERRDRSQLDGHHGDSSSSDDEDEEDDEFKREPLQIEAPPVSRTPTQNPTLPERPRASNHSLHGSEKTRVNQSTAQA